MSFTQMVNALFYKTANLQRISSDFRERSKHRAQNPIRQEKVELLEKFEATLVETRQIISTELRQIGTFYFYLLHKKSILGIYTLTTKLKVELSGFLEQNSIPDELIKNLKSFETFSKNIRKITDFEALNIYPIVQRSNVNIGLIRDKLKDVETFNIGSSSNDAIYESFEQYLGRNNIDLEAAIDQMTRFLQFCPDVKYIDYSTIYPNNYNSLFQELANLRNLEEISFYSEINHSDQDNQVIHQGLLRILNTNRNFNSLATPMSFAWDDEQFDEFIQTAQQNQIKFKHLDFAYGGCIESDLTDQQVRALSDFLRDKKSASQLESLRFRTDAINQETVRYFCETLKTLNLKELYLGEFYYALQQPIEVTLVCDENDGLNTLSSIEMLVETALQNPNLEVFNVVDTPFISREDFLKEEPDQDATYTEFERRLSTALNKVKAHCEHNKDKNNKDFETKVFKNYAGVTGQQHLLNLEKFLGKKDLTSLQIATAAGCKSSNGEARDLLLFESKKSKKTRRSISPSSLSSKTESSSII